MTTAKENGNGERSTTIGKDSRVTIGFFCAAAGCLVSAGIFLSVMKSDQTAQGVKLDVLIKAVDEIKEDQKSFDKRLRDLEIRRE